MIQTILIKISATTPKPRMIPNDTERQRALEGLPHYWKMPWPYLDVVYEPCGFARYMPVDRLMDPDYKLEPVCPWLPGEHTHLAGDQNL